MYFNSQKIILTLSFTLWSIFYSFTQISTPLRQVVTLEDWSKIPLIESSFSNETISTTHAYTVELKEVEPFLAYSVQWFAPNWDTENIKIEINTSPQQDIWEEWIEVEEDPHSKKIDGRYVSHLLFTNKNIRYFKLRFRIQTGTPFNLQNLEVHFFNPTKTKPTEPKNEAVANRDMCICPQPAYEARMDWCPNGNCPPGQDPTFTDITHMVIHHTATSNTANDWAAVVRSIWDFHVNSNGWDDIGYNWLIDPNGVLYEGRGNNIQGAHFCGMNTSTMGTGMLGNFQEDLPTQAAKNTLINLHAWKACDKDIDPLASAFHSSSNAVLPQILGHRDGCSTACPGDMFYPQLPDIRQDISDKIAIDCQAGVAAPTNLDGEAVSGPKVNLTWTDNSTDETGFVLERSLSFNNNYMLLAELPANTTTYEDQSIVLNSGYFYRVQAVLNNAPSFWSNELFILANVSSVEDAFLNTQTVQFFPNPTAGQLQVLIENDLKGILQMEILDVLGKKVWKASIFHKKANLEQFEMNIEDLPKGEYLLKIQLADRQGIFKVVKL